MVMALNYKIDDLDFKIEIPESTTVYSGEDICLSKKFNDITSEKSWYDQGFKVARHTKNYNILNKIYKEYM